MNMQQQQQQQPHQLTPYYAPAPNGDDRTQYNANNYYNNYGYSPSQAPPHPEFGNALSVAYASPPAPTYQQVQQEFGTNNGGSPSGNFDLLDDQQPMAASQTMAMTNAPPSEIAVVPEDEGDDYLAAIIASQERAFEEAKQRSKGDINQTSFSGSRALTVREDHLPVVRESHNPVGSDAVHPNRNVWKQTRGAKTTLGATGGAVVGGLVFGPAFPVGMVLGGAVGGYATNKLSKQGERRAQREWEKSSVRYGAEHSALAKSHAQMV